MIQTPGHGSLPSGHATENFMTAWVLWKLGANTAGDVLWLEQSMRLATRIAANRTIAACTSRSTAPPARCWA